MMDQAFFQDLTPIEMEVDHAFGAVAFATVKMESFGWLASLIGGPEFVAARDDLLQKQRALWDLVSSSKEHLNALLAMEACLKDVCSGRDALCAMSALGMDIRNLPR